ncbi:MAG: nitrate reductase [Planctomycetales bacterium]|nr:nitrate reductase [Planctomycetales bacterium]
MNQTRLAKDLPAIARPLLPILQRISGSMTRELVLEPGRHGLGLSPRTLECDATTTSVCGFCATGCGLQLHLRNHSAVGVTPNVDYPVNLGMACPKGWESLRVLESDDRATEPLLRDANGKLCSVTWHTALITFCERLKKIQHRYGKASVAFLSTGQIASEEMAFLGALAKFGMGMQHGDGNTRQCMATAVTAYKESFGFDAPPYTYSDFEASDCMVFVGANPCIGHPIMWERVLRNRNQPEIIVLDPRRTETAMASSQHLQLKPKTDLALLYAITHEIIQQGLVDYPFVQAHASGFEELRDHVARFPATYVSAQCGLDVPTIQRAARTIGTAKACSLWWTMGVNQSYEGVRTAQAIINIALITGNIGRPGTGANSITGQCNAMGSRLWSNTTNLIGHHQFEVEADRAKVAEVLGIPVAAIPTSGSWTYERILEGIERDEIKGLWLIATNPAHSWIGQTECQRLLSKLEFLVVQDMYASTETVRLADLVLPAAGWGEKEGTFINSERRYGLHKRVRNAPGEALADFQIFRAIAKYWGVEDMFSQWTTPEAVFKIMQHLSAGQACDITGIHGYEQIERCNGIQWPWTRLDDEQLGAPEKERRLFSDGHFFTTDGRARLIVADVTAMPEPPCDEFPWLLLTGRGSVSQWHTQTRTSKSPMLRKLYPQNCYAELNPRDARELGIENGEGLRVSSRRGSIQVRAQITPSVRSRQVFIPMHYPETNQLTLPHFDPYSRQPSYKNCAVRLERI